MIEITQADREAAAQHIPAMGMAHAVLNGKLDSHTLVQAFAHHRIEAVYLANQALRSENERLHDIQGNSANPDPLTRLIDSIAITLDADDLRAALDEAGLEIREKGK